MTVYTTSTINAITSVSAIIGNFLIIYVILKHRRLCSPSNLLLGSLSVTDFLVGLIVQPLFVVRKSLEIHNIYICIVRLIFHYFGFLCAVASFLNIALISVDRCFAVVYPFRYDTWTQNWKYCCVIMGVWTAWGAYNLLGTLNFLSQKQFLSVVIVTFVISAAVVIISYCLIYRVVRRYHRQTMSTEGADEEVWSKRRRENHQMAKIFAITIGVFLLCYIPALIVLSMRAVTGGTTDMIYIGHAWGDTSTFINSSLNPLIYCYRIREIREAVLDTVCRKRRSNERNSKQLEVQHKQDK